MDLSSRASTSAGQTFAFADVGSGPLVVLVHGFPDTPHGWEAIATAVAGAGHRVVVPWLRGYHPDTHVAGRGFGAEEISADLVALLDALDVPSAVLVGHDWGASMVYGAANLAPERVRAIVPIDIPHPSLITPSPAAAWAARHFLALKAPWAERTVARDDFAYVERLYSRWAPEWSGPERDACLRRAKECFADPASLTGAVDHYRALSPRPAKAVAAVPRVPALVVGGGGFLDPELYHRTAAATGPGSRALVVDGVGHWPHREAEGAFTEALLDFLSSLDEPG